MDQRLNELLNNYYEITKIMYSAIKARSLEIFQEQVDLRKECLLEFSSYDKSQEFKDSSKELLSEISNLESLIEEESVKFKEELEKDNNSAKVKFSAIKKSNDVSKKYRYSGINQYGSSYIDQKK